LTVEKRLVEGQRGPAKKKKKKIRCEARDKSHDLPEGSGSCGQHQEKNNEKQGGRGTTEFSGRLI